MSSFADSFVDEELEYTEMKPMAIYHFTGEETPYSDFPPLAEMPTEFSADLPTASFSEMAFTSSNKEEIPIRRIKIEPVETHTNSESPVDDSSVSLIHIGATFGSFAEFESAFLSWKEAGHHPMRIASSEALKDLAGRVDAQFRYKHAVYHCAHYGKPRFRGNGTRPNQSYLPCGCPAMFRLNFNYSGQVLRITSMNEAHVGHPVTHEHYKAVCSNVRPGKRSRATAESLASDSSSPVSPSSSHTATPISIKQEIVENTVQQQSESLANFQNQESEQNKRVVLGISTTPSCSGRKNYGRKRKEIDEGEWTPKVKRERLDNNESCTSRIENEVLQGEQEDTVIDIPALPGLPKMQIGAAYKNWLDFESAFEHWKSVGMHPMRVASSEIMKDLNGVPNAIYKYKYVVFHCAHYGNPRIRGNGLRPNQSYLPCGCGSSLRLAYNFEDQTLRVNSIVEEHRGHPRDRKFFEKVMTKIRSSKARRGTANFTNSAVSTPVVAQPTSTAVKTEVDIDELISMLSTQQQVLLLLQQHAGTNNEITGDITKL